MLMAELPELYGRRPRDSEALLKHTATEAAHTVSRPKRRRLERTPRKYFTLYGRNVTLGNLPEDYISTQRRKEVAHRRSPTRSVCSTTYHLLLAVGRSTYYDTRTHRKTSAYGVIHLEEHFEVAPPARHAAG